MASSEVNEVIQKQIQALRDPGPEALDPKQIEAVRKAVQPDAPKWRLEKISIKQLILALQMNGLDASIPNLKSRGGGGVKAELAERLRSFSGMDPKVRLSSGSFHE